MAPNTAPVWVRSAPSPSHAWPGLTLPWTLVTPMCPRPPHHFCRTTQSPSFLLSKWLPVTPLQDSPQPLPCPPAPGSPGCHSLSSVPAERLRLADGPHGCAGRLEVWHGGRWGTVCDDGWDLRDAAVACRELGCGGALAAPGGAFFGEGAGPVWLSELACRGGERQLGLCPHRGWKAHICSHEEDAGVVCAGKGSSASSTPRDPQPSN